MDPHELYGSDNSDESGSESDFSSESESEDELPEQGWYIRNYGHLMLRDIIMYSVLGTTKERSPKKLKEPGAKSTGYKLLWEFFSDFLAEEETDLIVEEEAEDKDPEKLQEDLDDYIEDRRRIDLAIKTKLKTRKGKRLDITDDIVNFDHKLDGVDSRLLKRLSLIWQCDVSEHVVLPEEFSYNRALTDFQSLTEVLGILQKQAVGLNKKMDKLGLGVDSLEKLQKICKECDFGDNFNKKVHKRANNELDTRLDIDEVEEVVIILRKVLVTLQYLSPFIREIERLWDAVRDFRKILDIDDILITKKSSINNSKNKPIKRINLGDSAGMTPIPMNIRRNPLKLQGGTKGMKKPEEEHPSGHEFDEQKKISGTKNPFEDADD